MIKTKNGNLKIKGGNGELLADLTIIIHGMYNEVLLPHMSEEAAKEAILSVAKRGLMSEKEMIADMVRETCEKAMKRVQEQMDEEGEKVDA